MALHGRTHGMRFTREYNIWDGMKKRCFSPACASYKNYGAKGITVCDKWMKFEGFFEDMGLSNGLCLDRIDNNKGYSKENCRWVSYTENNRNKKNNILVEGKTLSEWSEITGLSTAVISYRIKRMGMSPEAAVKTPLMKIRS